jgi:uncharacterized protein YjcR
MTQPSKQPKPAAVEARKQQRGRCLQAYEHWVKNPYLRLVDLGDKFSVAPDAIRHWVKSNGYDRPDGKGFRPVTSDRKQRIIDAYHAAAKEGKDILWAVAKANEGLNSRSVSKGDLGYYAVKNDLPELPSPPSKYLTSTKYG